MNKFRLLISFFFVFTSIHHASAQDKVLAHWRFEQIQNLDGELVSSVVGEPLTAGDRGSTDPQPYAYDDAGNKNFLQVRGSHTSPIVFSDDVPTTFVDGEPNTRSLAIKRGEYVVPFDRSLPYYDLRKSWTIEASLKCKLLGTEQVYLCKEGERGQIGGDVSIGFDNMLKRYFVEVMDADGKPHRIAAGNEVEAGKWYDVRAQANYDDKSGQTKLSIKMKASGQTSFGKATTIMFDCHALKRNAGMWVIGRGYPGSFPNSLAVLDGGIDEVRISGEALPRIPGQNPIFTDTYTADPATLVVGDTLYVYVGHDKASPGGWFYIPEWLCYSTTDMVNWTVHGPVLAAKDFVNADPGAAWAAEVVEKDGKYYYYVTLNSEKGHFITVAVSDSPTGPFKEARLGEPLITDDMTTDSHRANSDIDPTVFIDDDGTPWMAWGNGDCYMVKLNRNMVELNGPIFKVPYRNFAEGPWIFKRGDIYYNVYAADAPGVQPEQIAYATAPSLTGPWTYGGLITGPAKHGFTIHPAVVEFKEQWYFFYHDGSNSLNCEPGGDCRRSVCVEYLYFNHDGTIKPIKQTPEGVSVSPKY
ncbi:MAG: family 43 glycosylhydrolase [Spirochaetales bacterium]|jgi:hypothetical protein|nr:family 43 glycosylhydrolase [Spirochaetales bacterium]